MANELTNIKTFKCRSHNPKYVITVPADVPAPNNARPSADTVLTTKLYIQSNL